MHPNDKLIKGKINWLKHGRFAVWNQITLFISLLLTNQYAPSAPLAELVVAPSIIKPSIDRTIRFSIQAKNIPEPGLSAFALEVQFLGAINLIPDLQEQESAPLPPDKVSCSGVLKPGPASEVIIANTLIQMQSGLGDGFLNGLGTGSVLSLKNEINGDTARLAFGLAGNQSTIKPLLGEGALIEFRCLAGKQLPKNTTITIQPRLIPGTDGALFLFAKGEPEQTSISGGIIQIDNSGQAPKAQNDSAESRINEAIDIAVTDNDTDAEDGIPTGLVDIKTLPQQGTVTLNGQLVHYIPTTGFKGDDHFVYTVKDSHGLVSNEATVTIHVGTLNTPPLANNDVVTVQEDNPIDILVLSNDQDIDSDSLVITTITPALNGTAVLQGNAIHYQPNSNYYGQDAFSYQISDGRGGSANAGVKITVQSVNDAPVANNDTTQTDEDTSTTLDVLANDTDVEHDTLTLASITQGLHGAVDLSGNKLTYTPNKDFNGSDSFTYQINDGNGGKSEATVSVTIKPVNDAPVALIHADKNAAIKKAIAIDGSSSYDPDNDSVTFLWKLTKPNGSQAKLTDSSRILAEFTPDLAGTYGLNLTVTDAQGEHTQTDVKITAKDALQGNIAPNADIFVISDSVLVNQLVELDAALSNDPDKAPNDLTYHWDMLKRPTTSHSQLQTAESELSSFIPDIEGQYQLRLTVSDGNATTTAEMTIKAGVMAVPPVASAGDNQVITKQQKAILSGDASKNANGDSQNLTYLWTVVSAPAGSQINNTAIKNRELPAIQLLPDLVGDYLIRLDVTDAETQVDFDQVVVTVNPPKLLGDYDGDQDIDLTDLNLYKTNPIDMNNDGVVNILDYRALVLRCTRPKCAN